MTTTPLQPMVSANLTIVAALRASRPDEGPGAMPALDACVTCPPVLG